MRSVSLPTLGPGGTNLDFGKTDIKVVPLKAGFLARNPDRRSAVMESLCGWSKFGFEKGKGVRLRLSAFLSGALGLD